MPIPVLSKPTHKGLKLVIRQRHEVANGAGLVSVWLLEGDGVTQGLLHGVMFESLAKLLEEEFVALGIEVTHENGFYGTLDEPHVKTVMERNQSLFEAIPPNE